MSRTVLHVLPHTHWDREWYEPFESYRLRLVAVGDQLLDLLEREPGFHFHFDGQTAAIEDYLAVRPHAESRVSKLAASWRLAVGPWRILMDEFLCSPETIIRNLRQGMATAERLGTRPVIGYIPDSFGHVAQMPQILALAGMTWATVWRGVPGSVDRPAFRWIAPDGTSMPTLYLATSYSNAATLPASFEDLMVRAKRIVEDMEPFAPTGVVLGMNGTDHLAPQAHLPNLLREANREQDEIEFVIGPLKDYVRRLPEDEPWPEWEGEMRSSARANLLMGVLSARMSLKQGEMLASSTLERYAEPLCALSGFDPGTMLDECWRALVENSAHDSVCGCGIDAVAYAVASRYERAARVATLVRDRALTDLAARVRCEGPLDTDGLLIFNPSPFPRSGPVEATVPLPAPAEQVRFLSPDGRAMPVQVLDETEQIVVDMTLRGAELARLVPAIHSRKMGNLYVNRMELLSGRVRTVRLDLGPVETGSFDVEGAKRTVEQAANASPRAKFRVIGAGPPLARVLVGAPPVGGLGWTTLFPHVRDDPFEGPTAGDLSIDNGIVRVEANDDGTVSIVSGSLRFEGVGLRDSGDAGDEYTWSPPAKDSVVTAPSATTAAVEAAGPLEARLVLRQVWRLPESLDSSRAKRARRTVECPVTMTWAVREGEPFARVTIDVDNVAKDHRLRLHVPLPFTVDGSDADTAFHVTRRGLEGESAPHEVCTPTFPSRRWVDVSDGKAGLAVLHRGTPEYEVTDEGSEIAVTLLRCVGWLSRQDCATRLGAAGPMMPAPGAQMIGPARFELALFPHQGDWRSAYVHRVAESFSYPFAATVVRDHDGDLPPAGGALTIEPDCMQLSAFERTGDATEVRFYNASPEQERAWMRIGEPLSAGKAEEVGLLGEARDRVALDDISLRPWQIVTIRLS